MQYVARALPPAYVFENMRCVIGGGQASAEALARSIVLAGLDITLAYWFFSRVYRYAVRTGLIARYSAESVS